MILSNLYKTALIEPAESNIGDELFAVSGYASATFTRRHLNELRNAKGLDFKLNLIIGMPSKHNDHSAFLQLLNEYEDSFNAYYLNSNPPVHAKVYSWFKNGEPALGYSGSANYSQFGFFEFKQVNQITAEDPVEIKTFFDSLLSRCVRVEDAYIPQSEFITPPTITGSVRPGEIQWIETDQIVKISFLNKQGVVPIKSGLNWGQRDGRNRNQAYLSIKTDATKEGFLPERGFTFTLLTDDNKAFDCVVAQDGRKAVHTTYDNSELGLYLRERFGLPSETFIETKHLENYGRTDFTLIKIDNETFKLDLSV